MAIDLNGLLFKPYDKQLEVIEALDDPEIFFVVLVAGRQSGKTTLAQNYALKYALENNDVTVQWISPTDSQAQKVYKQIVKVFPPKCPIVAGKLAAKGTTELSFVNGSVIKFRSARSGNSLRGETNHFIIVDEAALILEETVESIIKPTQNTIKSPKILFTSTPKGKNWLYNYFNLGFDDNEPRYKSFHFTCYDSPYHNRELIADAKNKSIENRFRQEYLAEFVDGASVFRNIFECSTQKTLRLPEPGDRYYAGVDVGLLTDATALTILNGAGNMVKYYRWEKEDSGKIIDRIEEINRSWNFQRILFETNNHGLPMYQELKKRLRNIEDINTSLKTKPRMIERLIYLFENRLIRIIDDVNLRTELDAFNSEEGTGGYVKYGASSGNHDDMVMSLAIARECYERSRYNPRYVGFF